LWIDGCINILVNVYKFLCIFLLGLIVQPKDLFYVFKVNVANFTEWWKRQLKYSYHTSRIIWKILRYYVFFLFLFLFLFFCMLYKSLMLSWYSYACRVIKYKLHMMHSFPPFEKRGGNKYIRMANVYNNKHVHFMKKWVP
jgi:hypothetical protein